MDAETFLLKRREIQARLQEKRSRAAQGMWWMRPGLLVMSLAAGAGLLLGFRSNAGPRRWFRDLVWTAVVHRLFKDGLFNKIAGFISPSSHPKQPSRK